MRGCRKCLVVLTIFFLIAAVPAAIFAVTIDDVYLHHKFDDTSGNVFADSGNNHNDATLYRYERYAELPAIDASHVMFGLGAPFDGALRMGTSEVEGLSTEVMIDVPSSPFLPGPGDSFAVSLWVNVADWGTAYGALASYNLHGLEWVIGMHNHSSVRGLCVYTNDAGAMGDPKYAVNCENLLIPQTFAHFVIQFEGTDGITGIYVDGATEPDTGSDTWFWPSNEECFVINGRVHSMRTGFFGATSAIDDFAVIPGVLTQAQVDSIRATGVAGSGVTSTVHYALDESAGSDIADTSSHGLHGNLIGYDKTQVREARPVTPVMVPGVHGTAADFRGGWDDYAKVEFPTNMPPARGISANPLTVLFWLNAERWDWTTYGEGVLFSQNLDGFALTIGPNDSTSPDTLLVRTGTATGTLDMAGIKTTTLGLVDGEFAHFAVTIDELGTITGIHVNGVLIPREVNNGWLFGDDGIVTLGARIRGGTLQYGLDFQVDDFAIVKGALTQTQIEYAMNHGVEALYTTVIEIPGDATGDSVVDDADAKRLAANWGVSGSATWAMGDFDRDGKVGPTDAAIMAANWGYGVVEGDLAVPEPGMITLWLVAVLLVVATRRRGK
ncbi:MAG TPA: hypothetical protein DD670_02835 [Planctomycetaceae bacterium]|nr:hypothetical protein [Planctomycetaceae bacterium]